VPETLRTLKGGRKFSGVERRPTGNLGGDGLFKTLSLRLEKRLLNCIRERTRKKSNLGGVKGTVTKERNDENQQFGGLKKEENGKRTACSENKERPKEKKTKKGGGSTR